MYYSLVQCSGAPAGSFFVPVLRVPPLQAILCLHPAPAVG